MRIWFFRFLLAASGILLLVSLAVANGTDREPTMLAVATAPAATRTALPTATTWYHDVNPTKRAAMAAADARIAADLTEIALTPKPTPKPPPTPMVLQHWPPGVPYHMAGAGAILEEVQAPWSPMAFRVQNEWLEGEGHPTLVVYAGGDGERGGQGDLLQGLITVEVRSPDGGLASGPDFYQTPQRVGSVRIVDAVGERLQLQAADGTNFYFDLPTRQWVNP